jgi:hypothetical protein
MTKELPHFHDQLPANLFGNLLPKTKEQLCSRQNILIAGTIGIGKETFLKMLLKNLAHVPQENVLHWDMQLSQKIDTLPQDTSEYLLVMNKLHLYKNKTPLLEQIHTYQLTHPNLTVLGLTDHTGITHPQAYFAKTHPFFQVTYQITPFDLDATRTMILANSPFYGWSLSESQIKAVYALSGGIARLIKYICNEISEHNTPLTNPVRFSKIPAVLFQLQSLYAMLMTETKDDLKQLQILDKKGTIRSLLLRHYFKTQNQNHIKALHHKLNDQEQTVFSYLYNHKNQTIPIETIADLLAMTDESYSLWKIYKLISRLRPKLAPLYELRAKHGKGYYLVNSK